MTTSIKLMNRNYVVADLCYRSAEFVVSIRPKKNIDKRGKV